jgi:autotransporter-associated beta strand protein
MSNRKLARRASILAAAVAGLGLAASAAQAATKYWDANGSTVGAGSAGGLWDTSLSRWSSSSVGTAAPGTWTANDDAIFSAGNDLTGSPIWGINNGATQTANSVTFQEGTSTLSGGTLSLGAGGLSVLGANGVVTVNSNLALTASQTWKNYVVYPAGSATPVANALRIAGPVDLGGNTLTLWGSSSSSGLLTGVMSNGGFTKTGLGTFTFASANTYTGATTVAGGTLTLDYSAATSPVSNIINSGSALTMKAGTLQLTGKASTANTQTFNGVTATVGGSTISSTIGTGGTVASTLGTVGRTDTGTLSFVTGTGITYNVSNGNTPAGDILGTWAFTNNTDYAVVSGGAIAAAAIAASAETTWTSPTANYTAGGAGSITLTGGRSFNTLRLNVSGGASNIVMNANNVTANGILNGNTGMTFTRTSGNFIIGAAGQLVLGGTGAITIQAPITGTGDLVKTGTNTLTLNTNDSTFSGQIYVNKGTLAWDNASRISSANITGITLQGGAIQGTTAKAITVADVGGNALNAGVYSGLISGAGDLRLSGSAVLTNTSNSFGAGRTLVIGGAETGGDANVAVVASGSSNALGNASTIELSNNTNTLQALHLGGTTSGSFTVTQNIVATHESYSTRGAGLAVADNYTGTFTGALTVGNGVGLYVNYVNSPSTGYVASPGANSVMVLDGDLTNVNVTGLFLVGRGTLQIGANATLPTNLARVDLANTAGVKLDLNGRSATIAGVSGGGTTGGVVTNSSGTAATLTLNPTGAQSFAGVIDSANTINVIKTNIGTTAQTQTFTNNNTYTGSTTVRGAFGNGGTLALTGASASGKLSGTSSVTVQGGATFQNGDTTVANNTAARVNASSSVTLGGSNFGGGIYQLAQTNTGITQQHTTLTVDPGSSTINSTGSGSAALNLEFTAASGSQITRNTGGILTINTAANFGSVVGTGGVRFQNSYTLSNGLLGQGMFVNLTAGSTTAAFATVTSSGGLDYVSPLSVADSVENTWISSAANYAQVTTDQTLTGARTGNSLKFAVNLTLGANSLTVPNLLFLITGGQGNRGISGTGAVRPVASGSGELVVISEGAGSGNTLTISAPVTNTSTFTKGGSKQVTLSNSANSIGDIYINAGTLQFDNSGAVGGTTGTISLYGGTLMQNFAGTIGSGRPIVVGNVGGTIRALSAVDGSGQPTQIIAGDITLNGNLSLYAGTSGDDVALTGTISGPGAISTGGTKNSTTLLSGNNTFAGGVTVNHSTAQSGTSILMIGHDNALGTGLLTVTGKGQVLYAVNGDRTIANPVTTAGMGNNDGALGLAFAGTNSLTFTGPVTLSGNDAVVKVGITTAGKLVHISGPITAVPANGLGKNQAGILKLSGSSTYTGPTTLINGTLLIGADAPLGRPGALGMDATSGVVVAGSLTQGPTYTTAAGDILALLTDAAATVARNITVNSNNSGGTTTLGGNSAHTSAFTGTVALNRGVRLTAATGGDVTFGGIISDASLSNAIEKIGDGIVKLTAANTYGGGTTVNAGTLLVNNTSGSGTGTGAVQVNAGTLGGNGFISGAVTIGDSALDAIFDAVLSPGNSIDSIDTGNLEFKGDGKYEVQILASGVGSPANDVTNVTGSVTLGAAIADLDVSVAGNLQDNQKFFIIVNDDAGSDPVSGTFWGTQAAAALAQNDTVLINNNHYLKISYTGDSGASAISGGNDVVLYSVPIPEPSTFMPLAILALTGFFSRRRRG